MCLVGRPWGALGRLGALFWVLCGDVPNVAKCAVFERFMGLLWLLGAVVVGLVCGGWEEGMVYRGLRGVLWVFEWWLKRSVGKIIVLFVLRGFGGKNGSGWSGGWSIGWSFHFHKNGIDTALGKFRPLKNGKNGTIRPPLMQNFGGVLNAVKTHLSY